MEISLVIVNTYALQRDGRHFTDPERFDPSGSLQVGKNASRATLTCRFGGGPRVCIGNGFAMMEARLILATMAQCYKLSLERPDEVAPMQLVTLRPSGPVRMRLKRREPGGSGGVEVRDWSVEKNSTR